MAPLFVFGSSIQISSEPVKRSCWLAILNFPERHIRTTDPSNFRQVQQILGVPESSGYPMFIRSF